MCVSVCFLAHANQIVCILACFKQRNYWKSWENHHNHQLLSDRRKRSTVTLGWQSFSWHRHEDDAVVTRFVTTACFVTKVILPAHFVTPAFCHYVVTKRAQGPLAARFVTPSPGPLSLVFPFPQCVCVCVDVDCPWQRACIRVCVLWCIVLYYPHLSQC